METKQPLPPLPLEAPEAENVESLSLTAPPPPPLQTSSDAEEMDVSSGGDGHTHTPVEDAESASTLSLLLTKGSVSFSSCPPEEGEAGSPSPRTARHAPPITKFLPDPKLLRDVKISVSFTESSRSKDRTVLYTGVGEVEVSRASAQGSNGEMHEAPEAAAVGREGVSAGRQGEDADSELENRVEFAVLDELEDLTSNFLEAEDGERVGFRSEVIVQREQADNEGLDYSYEVGSPTTPCQCVGDNSTAMMQGPCCVLISPCLFCTVVRSEIMSFPAVISPGSQLKWMVEEGSFGWYLWLED